MTLNLSEKTLQIIAGILGVVLAAIIGFALHQDRRHERELIALQNEVAKRDKTIEVQKQVYAKLIPQIESMKGSIDTNTAEGKRLADEIKKQKAELVSVNNALIKLKDQVAEGIGKQEPVSPGRDKVTFDHDFGFAAVSGFTITNPPEYKLKLYQGSKPLKLTLALTQQEDKSWKSYVASSDDSISVEIGVSAVNPYHFDEKWYEKFSLKLDLGVGDGVLAGFGASYRFGNFNVGPSVWGTISGDNGSVFYGGSFTWSPFKRN